MSVLFETVSSQQLIGSNCLAFHSSLRAVMAVSPTQAAKLAFITVLLYLASNYCLTLPVRRDSEDKMVLAASRKVALKGHPDKGGSHANPLKLNNGRAVWEEAKQKNAVSAQRADGHQATGPKTRGEKKASKWMGT